MNRNDFVKFFLRTPLHIFMGNTMLITVTGRKTGKQYTTPVGYFREGDELWVISSRERTWWRNVRGGAEVTVRLHGKDMTGFAETILDEVTVAVYLGRYLHYSRLAARGLGIRVINGEPHPEDVARVIKERLFVRVRLNSEP